MSTVQEIKTAIEHLSPEEYYEVRDWLYDREDDDDDPAQDDTPQDDTTPVPASHQAELDSRWADYKAGKIKRISLDELMRRAFPQ
ncbi:MAG: addiction module protein [Opitutaceae bacterium]|jgi:putative addiction module component (TIGR02574 family)|nr:addiction module protein [Opitutaceae bacterium]